MKSRLPKFLQPYQWLRFALKNSIFTFDELRSAQFTYSQFGEDIIVSAMPGLDKLDGFFVDVGAFHPISLSNTYLFHKRGWKGINIEPNPQSFQLFPAARPNDINLNTAVSPCSGEIMFSCDDQFSGIVGSDEPLAKNTISVPCSPLADILAKHLPDGQIIDFLSIDCEGYDYEVLTSNDWNKYRPNVILVEEHGEFEDGKIYKFLTSNGYEFVFKTGLTLIFRASSGVFRR